MKRRQEAEELEAAVQKKKKEVVERRSRLHGVISSDAKEESRIKLSRKGKSQSTCSLCGQLGHNRRKCLKVMLVLLDFLIIKSV